MTGQCLQVGLGGQIGPVRTSCCDLKQECERVEWGETDSGQGLEAEASLSGQSKELLADGGMSPGTETEARRDEEVTAASNETEDGALEHGGEGDAHAGAADDISASSCQEEEERKEMEEQQSGAVEEEEVSMDASEVAEETHRC